MTSSVFIYSRKTNPSYARDALLKKWPSISRKVSVVVLGCLLLAGLAAAIVVLKPRIFGSISAQPPVANFAASAENVWVDNAIQFTDTSVRGSDTISSILWDFGDGATSVDRNPVHTYASPGTYVVKLTVTDTAGATNTYSKSISVAPSPPIANFSFLAENVKVEDSTQFTDNSIGRMGTITNWVWKFGDGTESTAQDPTHSYSSPGVYTITLTVRDNNAQTSTCTKSISVSQTRNFIWSYAGKLWYESITITNELQYYQNLSHTLYVGESCLKFVTPEDNTIVKLTNNLKTQYQTMGVFSENTHGFANFALRFVQALGYEYGWENLYYWSYPLEILVRRGTCDSKSRLYVSILEAAGYDTCLLGFPFNNHMMGGVHLDEVPPTHNPWEYYNLTTKVYTKDNREYYPCETTVLDWSVGEISTDVADEYPQITIVA